MMFRTLALSVSLFAAITGSACGQPEYSSAEEPVAATANALARSQAEPEPMPLPMSINVEKGLPQAWFTSRAPEARPVGPAKGAGETSACAPWQYMCCWAACWAAGQSGPTCEGVCNEWTRRGCPGTSCQ